MLMLEAEFTIVVHLELVLGVSFVDDIANCGLHGVRKQNYCMNVQSVKIFNRKIIIMITKGHFAVFDQLFHVHRCKKYIP